MKVLLLSILIFTTTLFASIGKIAALSGDVNILRESKIIAATLGFELQERDNIKTTKNGRVQLLFKDKTIISLGKNSTFNIEEYFYDSKKPEQTKASFKVAQGIFKTITGQIGKINPSKFKLKTKTASIGIRGTIYFVEARYGATYEQSGNAGTETYSCTSGSITVTDPTTGVTVEIPEGYQITAVPGKPLPQPRQIPPAEKEKLNEGSGASQNEKESGQDENAFFEEPPLENEFTPTEEVNNDLFIENSKNLAKESLDNSLNNDNKIPQLESTISDSTDIEDSLTIVHNINFSTNYTIAVNDPGFSFNYITKELLTSTLGEGILMEVPDINDKFNWGFWSSTGVSNGDYTAEKAWITGENIVTDLSGLTSSNNAIYNGQIMGTDSGGSLINPSNSTINLDFDFGSNKVQVSTQINGSTGFDIIDGDYTSNGSEYTITDNNQGIGQLKGSFYDNFNSTAGVFDVSGFQGVYKAFK